jgi:hypothetical protein
MVLDLAAGLSGNPGSGTSGRSATDHKSPNGAFWKDLLGVHYAP